MSDEIREALEKIFSADSDVYRQRGFQRRVGFGERPAQIHIDLANAWSHRRTEQIAARQLVDTALERLSDAVHRR